MSIFSALSEAQVGCPLTACPAIEHPARCRAETFMIYAGTACMQCDKCIPKGIKFSLFSLFSLCYQASICTFMCQIKVHKLKKMHKFMENFDIHFFFISSLYIIWT